MDALNKLIRKRSVFKAQLTALKNFIINNKDTLSNPTISRADKVIIVRELKRRQEKFQELFNGFNNIQNQIEEKTDEFETQLQERDDFEDIFFHHQAITDQLVFEYSHLLEKEVKQPDPVSPLEPLVKTATNETVSEQKTRRLNLPQIKLPSFNGNFENWMEFRDTFLTLIHNEPDLQNLEKFHYLRSALTGNAAGALRSIPFQADKYELAWKHICERYNNTSLIVTNHIKAIVELNSVQRESFTELSSLLDEATKHLESWESTQSRAEQFESLVVYILTTKLDKYTRMKWDECKTDTSTPLNQFTTFLRSRTEKLYSREGNNVKNDTKPNRIQSRSFLATEQVCELCKEIHQIYKCPKFISKQPNERKECVIQLKLCLNCLRSNHTANKCRSGHCRKCNGRHNTMLHVDEPRENSRSSRDEEQPEKTVSAQAISKPSNILLATAIVKLRDVDGIWHNARALLDGGSQSNFVTNELAKRLKYKSTRTNYSINGVNGTESNVKSITTLTIHSKTNKASWSLNFLIVPKITCELPATQIKHENWNLPDVELADENFHDPGVIDLLLGAELYYDTLQGETIKLSKDLPSLHKTTLGWIIGGKTPDKTEYHSSYSCLAISNNTLEQGIERFWKIEDIESVKHYSKEENACEVHFKNTHSRNEEGRYVVKLPLKHHRSELGNSKDTALRRFYAVERKLSTNDALRQQYTNFMTMYEDLGHMTAVEENHMQGHKNFLPHHAVFKENATTKQIRVVFDASCKTSTNISLNDISMVGPTIQRSLFAIVVQFRLYRFALTADIVKMYRQVLMHEEDQSLQLIVWRKETNQPIQIYKLNTITYVTASAPYLATKCLQQLATENMAQYTISSQAILNNFYVDDYLGGSNTIEEAIKLKNELTQILNSAGFQLDKWMSNSREIINECQHSHHLNLFQDNDSTIKTLGLVWNPKLDTICYKVKSDKDLAVTKRQILTKIAQLFDPLGLLGPVIVSAKCIMQKLWQLKTDWDEIVSDDISAEWKIFETNLPLLDNIQIPRYIVQAQQREIQIHGFADASERAYGAAIYIRSTNENGEHKSHLVCSKSRVAPLKTQSIPRLELCAALLLSNLYTTVTESLNIKITKTYLWSDSSITLHWINTEPYRLKPFIANRITKIQASTTDVVWRHVKSSDNPADILSRGRKPHQIKEDETWWRGPCWLETDEENWPLSTIEPLAQTTNNILELKSTSICHVSTTNFHIFKRYSTFHKLQRVTAYCIRFIENTRKRVENRATGPLTVEELNNSLSTLVKLAQQEKFSEEIKILEKTGYVEPTNNLKSLHPFLDTAKIIRVGGRLRNSSVSYEQKFPILLPKNHELTKLLIIQEHLKQLHAGPQMVLANLRLKFWPIHARSTIRNLLHKCVTCARVSPKPQHYIMGDLPAARVTPSKPFLNCGIDFCGPFYTKESRRRGKALVKTYICVFVCFSTRAVHLEFVSNLTTAAFLGAMKRFIARRGKSAHIYCDNATNFVGARNELEEVDRLLKKQENREEIQNYFAMNSMEFHFIPARSPSFGGLWEAVCKSVKFHLKRVATHANLTFEEFITLIAQIESCLNSRPITPISCDPHDVTVLTPGHFLIGTNPNDLAEQDFTDCSENRLTHWQRVQALYQHFWKRWSLEYLSQLQVRVKWQFPQRSLQVGDVVILVESTPPSTWRLGCIEAVHPGKDNVVRVVSVRTVSGVFKRACGKVCLLPVCDNIE